jgi:membrane-associated protease RseP (regulator of RpoE activity)
MEQHTPGFEDRSDQRLSWPGEAPPPNVSGVTDQFAPSPYGPYRVQRRVWLPLFLFVATCLSTFVSGTLGFLSTRQIEIDWKQGLIYMASVMGILLAHEMGHFLMTLRHHIPASWPFFIPMPLSPIGTMGAVIAMQGSRADRRQLFDIGLAGPLAGLLVCVPVLCLGIHVAEPGVSPFQQPLLTELLVPWIRPDLRPQLMAPNPLLMAGWVGLLVTGLNMLPISQLDGGHVVYALFRRWAHVVAYAFFFVAIVFIVWKSWMHWVLMLALVALIGVEHPRTANDHVRLGPVRAVLGIASLLIPALCFAPQLLDERHLAWLSLVWAW